MEGPTAEEISERDGDITTIRRYDDTKIDFSFNIPYPFTHGYSYFDYKNYIAEDRKMMVILKNIDFIVFYIFSIKKIINFFNNIK
jgi:hypothetical protein